MKIKSILFNWISGGTREKKSKDIDFLNWIASGNWTRLVSWSLSSFNEETVNQKLEGEPVLFEVLRHEKKGLLKSWLKHNIDLELRDPKGKTALMIAVEGCSMDVVRLLIDAGARCDVQDKKETLLIKALMRQRFEMVEELAEELIEKGANIHQKDALNWTSLMWAISSGCFKTALYLMNQGVDIHQKGKDGTNAVLLASEKEDDRFLEELLLRGALVNESNELGWTPIKAAASRGMTDRVKKLIEAGAEVDQAWKNEDTALIYAIKNRHIETARCLIEAGAGLSDDKKTKKGTALVWAVQMGFVDLVLLLMEKGANLNQNFSLNDERWTALMGVSACFRDGTVVLKELIRRGEKINAVSSDRETALMLAAKKGSLSNVQCLIDLGADDEMINNNKETALMCAKKHPSVVSFLESVKNAKQLKKVIADENVSPQKPLKNGEGKENTSEETTKKRVDIKRL